MSRRRAPWGWIFTALLSCAASAVLGGLWLSRHTAEASMRLEAGGRLSGALQRERAYFRNNHAYAASLEDLGLDDPSPGDWRYEVIATRLDDLAFLLIEADDDTRRLCIDTRGTLHASDLRPLPDIPLWLPATGGGRRGTSR
jgi:hypothetical protein